MYERHSEDDDRPWESPDAGRRDFEPHRGGLLTVLGGISFLLALGSICFPPLGFVGLGLVCFVWVSVQRDLAQIEAGYMDPAGKRPTKEALPIAFVSLIVTLIIYLIWGLLILNAFRVAAGP